MSCIGTQFSVCSPVAEEDLYFCRVGAHDVLNEPVKIYGSTPEEASSAAQAFCENINIKGTTGQRPLMAGAATIAIGTSAADGPLPFGEALGIIILVGAALISLVNVISQSGGDESACTLQYKRDCEVCRRLRSLGNRAICWAQAAQRRGNCLAGRPLPPLGF